ncbi:MAG TPA: HepT-like ribonuclease domain-containing protein [Planctomycetota bacterium]|nr:HepT-like ribonuclease domain-containing protein [Planctomycetota bacterium]
MQDRDPLHLTHILQAGEAILEYTTSGHDEFTGSRMVRDAVVRNLEVIGEAAKRISAGLRDQNPQVPWRKITGLRDIVVHQ